MSSEQATAAAKSDVSQSMAASSWRRWREHIADRFDHLSATRGDGPEASGYASRVEQRAGFRVLAETLPLTGRRILDVGCGLADFADYLTAHHSRVRYDGVDISPGVIAGARRRNPSLSLRVLDILEEDPGGPYDYVVASGVFHLLGEPGFDIMTALVSRMFALSRRAVAFTARSAWSYPQRPGEFHAEPFETLAFCRTLTPRVALRHDYSARDFAAFMYRRGQMH